MLRNRGLYSLLKLELLMKESGQGIREKAMEHKYGKMELSIKDTGKITKLKVLESLITLMVMFT
jgi:hypothetical protein